MSPPTSEAVPLLGLFFSSCMLIVTASTVFTVYVLNLHYRTPETHEMGTTARTLLLYWLPWILRMERPGIILSWETLPSLLPCSRPKNQSQSLIRNVKDNETGSRASLEIDHRVHQLLYGNGVSNLRRHLLLQRGATIDNESTNKLLDSNREHQALLLTLQRISRELRLITRRMTEADREGEQSSNWKFAAMVVDRLCLYLFSFLLIGTIVGVCVSAPYIIA